MSHYPYIPGVHHPLYATTESANRELTESEAAEEARLDAEWEAKRDNAREPFYDPFYEHYDTGACGRDVCQRHGTELDAFGCCFRCDCGE